MKETIKTFEKKANRKIFQGFVLSSTVLVLFALSLKFAIFGLILKFFIVGSAVLQLVSSVFAYFAIKDVVKNYKDNDL